MRYLSVCSGIEAATVAWHPLGWTPVGFSEIEAFPSAVLAHHYPDVPNHGDMNQHEQWPIQRGAVDVLVGGTPCQSFSVAGLRKGLRDPRGGLMLTYLEIAQRLRPRWVVWENVPGVLSSNGGRDFGSFLGALGELGYGWAYRVLDAQWCRTHRHPRAVPQRRRRVFVVGCLADGDTAAKVLFERESVRRDTAARRAAGQGAAPDVEGCAPTVCSKWGRSGSGGPAGDECQNLLPQWWDGSNASHTLTCRNAGGQQRMPDISQFTAVLQPVAYRWQNDCDGLQQDDAVAALRASAGTSGFHEINHPVVACVNMQGSKSNACVSEDGSAYSLNAMHGHGVHAVAHAFYSTDGTHSVNQHLEVSPAVKVGSGLGIPSPPAVAFPINGMCVNKELRDKQMTGTGSNGDPMFTVRADGTQHAVATRMSVRRLTPRECERLQGFPDDYTAIPWRGKAETPDGPRYKALGNSMAVNCMEWIGERIAAHEVAQ